MMMTFKRPALVSITFLAILIGTSCGLDANLNPGIYPLDMRNSYQQRTPETNELEWIERQWRMDIPIEYIMGKRGRNGVSRYSKDRGRKNPYSISLSTQINLDTMELLPNPYMRQAGHIDTRIDIYLSNGRPRPKLRSKNDSGPLCLTLGEVKDITNVPRPAAGDCSPTKKLCNVFTYLDGWSVRMSVSRNFYETPQPFCNAARDFLDGMTINRDDQSAMP